MASFSSKADGLQNAFQHLKQERRFFRLQHPKLATATDTALLDRQIEEHQRQIQRESSERNELGLYRNASLVLACIYVSRNEFEAALAQMLDVVFLDLAGATNSLPGHKSFDSRLSLLVPFAVAIIRDLLRTLDISAEIIERPFKTRWQQFSSFGAPPFTPDALWRTLQGAIRT